MKQKAKSAICKEAWFNSNSNGDNLIIIDTFTGKVMRFNLVSTEQNERYHFGSSEYIDAEETYGANGWKRMRRLEESD